MSTRQSMLLARVLRSSTLIAAAAVILIAAPLSAQTSPAAPKTVPAKPQIGVKVAVVSLGTAGDDAEGTKMASAVKQSLTHELSQGGVDVIALGSADDSAAARKNARDMGAAYAVTGDVQAVAGSVRIVGQVHDVKSDKVIAPLQATGPSAEFFGVQDEFVRQAKAAVASATGNPGGNAQPIAGIGSPVFVGPGASSVPAATGSHWAGFAAESASPTIIYAPPSATPPPPPLYGGYQAPYLGGGGGYYDPGYNYPPPDVITPVFPLGTVRTEYYGKLGVSIIPPSPGLSRTGFTVPSDHYRPSQAPLKLPEFNQSIRNYKNPNTRFAAPVGQPQRAATPTLRPGT